MSTHPRLSGPAATALPAGGERIVITGASGWIGKATLELLYNTLGPGDFAKRVFAFGSAPRTIDFGAGTIEQRPLIAMLALPSAQTLVLHLAFLTKDKVAGMDEEEYCRLNRALGRTVLEALDMIGTSAVFVASSGAAQFVDDADASPEVRLYGSLKKADEEAFARWAEERGRRAVIARIFALSGPHINKHDTYALASFIRDALAGGPITIWSDHPVYRSYVSIRELMSLVFGLVLEEAAGVVRFSTGGERLEMQRVAEIVSETLGPVAIERPPLKSGPIDEYVGDAAAYEELLTAHGIDHLPFAQQVVETAASFGSQAASEERSRYA
ncbi:MAG TPA: NAD(P)-dependent oxidoreductase [Sphingomicrobium sp.]